MEINKIYNEDCLDTMANMPDNFIDLTVTSPPYDNLRTYTGEMVWNENVWKSIIKELYRVTKKGGVVVWIVGDATVKGSETGTSFKQALFAKENGFNLHDTMIWEKDTFTATGTLRVRYASVFEYMFIFVKGKLKTFNPIKDRVNKTFGEIHHGSVRQRDGSTKPISNKTRVTPKYGQRFNVWRQQAEKNSKIFGHPAMFPEQLINDHIISWSNEGDLVYDPFIGSGTTAKMAILNNRNYIGSEISKEYCDIIKERLSNI